MNLQDMFGVWLEKSQPEPAGDPDCVVVSDIGMFNLYLGTWDD